MNACTRAGLDVTWLCNWSCKHCFYLRNPKLHTAEPVPIDGVKAKARQAREGGLDHAVLVGYGEPSMCPDLLEIISYCHGLGMATSMITNGCGPRSVYENLRELGMDHLHISSHGLGDTLDDIAGRRGAYEQQHELKRWLNEVDWPYRMNVAMQRHNAQELAMIAWHEVKMGCYHVVLLGFLPHYEWKGHADEVAVHPMELRPQIEAAARVLLDAGTLFTIRYHPLCHLSPEFWRYVVNARYVFFDPWEWNYELQVHDLDALWRAAVRCGESVANRHPCRACLAYRHCGGWNRVYADAFDGAGLTPIREIPEQYKSVWYENGGLHDLNPANRETGTINRADVMKGGPVGAMAARVV